MHCVPAPLTLRGFGSGFRLSRARRLRRRIYYLARSESCASVRALRIRILSGCVGGFSCPKTGAQASTNVLSVTFPIQDLRASQKRSKVLFVACAMRRKHSWRIRLAAYGARLERVLGSRPRGFKSPILRSFPGFGFLEAGDFSFWCLGAAAAGARFFLVSLCCGPARAAMLVVG